MNLKNNKGSITIFVLTSCLLFIATALGIATFIKNKANNEEKQYQTIKANYEQNIDKIDEIYEEHKDILNQDVVINFDSKETYVIPTGETTVTISQRFNIEKKDEVEINNIEYAWTTTVNETISSWIELSKSDRIFVLKKENVSAGTSYLNVRINNNDEYKFQSSVITVSNDTISYDSSTKKITFGDNLKYNYKFGTGETEEFAKSSVISITVDNNNQYDITNIILDTYLYMEATDKYGNKVYLNY